MVKKIPRHFSNGKGRYAIGDDDDYYNSVGNPNEEELYGYNKESYNDLLLKKFKNSPSDQKLNIIYNTMIFHNKKMENYIIIGIILMILIFFRLK